MKIFLNILGVLLGIIAVVFLVITFSAYVEATQTDSWLTRAKDAGNPAQVSEFLTDYKDSLYQNGKVEGKYTSFFKYPGSSMPTYIRAIDGLIQRADDLSLQISTDTSYQMGLVNLEKDLGDIETAAYSVWKADGGVFFVIIGSVLIVLFSIPLVIASTIY